jgi:hypothetical protein
MLTPVSAMNKKEAKGVFRKEIIDTEAGGHPQCKVVHKGI